MIDYYHYQPQPTHGEQDTPPREDAVSPRRRHRLLKWTLLSFFFLLVLSGLLLLGGYWYLQNTTLASTSNRTNILLLGVDEAASLSDTIMLLSIDHTNAEDPDIAMLSVPRDLYIAVPGFYSAKINAAHAIGENNDHPGGGPALTSETIQQHFGVPIHYYVSINFDGFETIVDAVGGVEIDVKTTIDDPRYPDEAGGYDPLYIPAGKTVMDGDLALRYARSRQSTNDFDRAFRQQQIVLAIADKLVDDSELVRPRTIRGFVTVFFANTETDMSTMELLRFGLVIRNIDFQTTPQYVLDTTNFLTGVNNETGSALVPRTGNFLEIQQFVETIFSQDVIDQFSQQQF